DCSHSARLPAHGKHVWRRKEPPMDAISLDTTVKTSLALVRAKLEIGLRIARAAEVCSGSGRPRRAVEVARGLEEIVSDINTLLNAASIINRLNNSCASLPKKSLLPRQRRSASAGLRWWRRDVRPQPNGGSQCQSLRRSERLRDRQYQ